MKTNTKEVNDMGSEKINTGLPKSVNSSNDAIYLNHLSKVSTPESEREETTNE
jgi:hypothetical protein